MSTAPRMLCTYFLKQNYNKYVQSKNDKTDKIIDNILTVKAVLDLINYFPFILHKKKARAEMIDYMLPRLVPKPDRLLPFKTFY